MPPKKKLPNKRSASVAPQIPKKRLRSSKPKETIVIGIDFGTTFTSAAFAWKRSGRESWKSSDSMKDPIKEVNPLEKWQGLGEGTEVPSKLRYSKDGSQSTWGYIAGNGLPLGNDDATMDCAEFVKLALPSSTETKAAKEKIDEIGRRFKPEKTGREMIIDFLTHVYNELMGEFGYFNTHYPDSLAQTAVKWVFGVPAAWTESEYRSMLDIAQLCGFKDVSLVSEPEAIAHVFFTTRTETSRRGETFIILDCGGGTVDISSYTRTEHDPFSVSEAAIGEGVFCGATRLNDNFRTLISNKLRSETYLHDQLDKILKVANDKFDEWIKFHFDLSLNRKDWPIPVAGLKMKPNSDFLPGEILRVTMKEVQTEVFDPVINSIISLVRKQIVAAEKTAQQKRKTATAETEDGAIPYCISRIILAGGFGNNPYLYARLKAEFFDAPPLNKIPICKSDFGKHIVATGATLFGIKGSFVAERSSSKHYGVMTRDAYDSKRFGTREDNVIEQVEGDCERLCNINWVIPKGQSVFVETIEDFNLERQITVLPKDGEDTVTHKHEELIFESIADFSERFTRTPNEVYPDHCEAFRMEITFDKVPVDKLIWDDTLKRYWLYYNIHLRLEGTLMAWTVTTEEKDERGRSYAKFKIYKTAFEGEESHQRIYGTLRNRPDRPRQVGEVAED